MSSKFFIDQTMQFPLVEVSLNKNEFIHLQRGSMVFHSPNVHLQTKLNGHGSGFSKFFGAIGRAMTSGESMFITKAQSSSDGGVIALAPNTPGQVVSLNLGQNQYRLNDGAFLAMEGTADYSMEMQSLSKALFGGQGGLYVMTTGGHGELLINSFGSIKKIVINNDQITVDNAHVVAWSTSLDYNIHFDSGILNSFGTGEGLVNTFTGTGEIYIQSLNLETFTNSMYPFIKELFPGN